MKLYFSLWVSAGCGPGRWPWEAPGSSPAYGWHQQNVVNILQGGIKAGKTTIQGRQLYQLGIKPKPSNEGVDCFSLFCHGL